jgi:D-serine deaminase-like pyridoxal phosphate-dependent protein
LFRGLRWRGKLVGQTCYTPRVQLTDRSTPRVIVDAPQMARNLDRMQALVASSGKALRPHAKTHKSPVIASEQLRRGAVGICCAKLGEAEVFVAGGCDDITLPYPLLPSQAARVAALLERARIRFIVDDVDVARAWSDEGVKRGLRFEVLLKVDVGFHRCGVAPEAARSSVRAMDGFSGLSLAGVLSHAGHAYGARSESALAQVAVNERVLLETIVRDARRDGIDLPVVSVGATPTARFSAAEPGITEMRPGNYVYFDRTALALGAATLDECALFVMTTVVSRPAADRFVLDAGSKTLSSDPARGFEPQQGHGLLLAGLSGREVLPALVIERLSEEHATVRVSGDRGVALQQGDRVRVLPNHSCVVSNLVDEIDLVDNERILEVVPVAARGRIA